VRPGKLTGLAARNLRRNLRYHLLAGTAIAVGVAAFAFFLGLGEGVQARVVGPLAETLPPSELEVKPKKVSLGVFQLDRPSLFGGARFDDAALEKLAAIPGVTAVHGTMNILFPIMAWGRFFGKGVRTDLIVTGVDERLVRAELGPDVPFAYEEGHPVPLVASPHLLELYNASFAKMNGLPQVTPEILKGLRFNLVLGKSYLAGTPDPDKVQTVTCEFVGFSRHAVLIGASVPLAFVRAMNARFVPREAGIYRSAVVSAASASPSSW